MENNRYRNINELISEVEALGDWKDISQRRNFLKIIAKVKLLYQGYEIANEKGETIRENYPTEVFDAIIEVCKAKFPTDEEEVFDKEGKLKEGYPKYSNYLFLVKNRLGIAILGQGTRMGTIAKEEFKIDVFDRSATREEVDGLITSSKEYLNKKKEQELDASDTDSERQKKEESIRKSRAEKQIIEHQIAETDKKIEELTKLLEQEKAKRTDLSKLIR